MRDKKFEIGEAIRFGWGTFRANAGFLMGVTLFVFAVRGLGVFSQRALLENHFSAYIVVVVALWVIQTMLYMGLTRVTLRYCDGEKAVFGDVFSCMPIFLRYLATAVLYGLIVIGGLILLIVPGVIWAIKYSQSLFLVIDRGLAPSEALRTSGRITQGAKWDLFLFGLLTGLINFAGALCLVIGLLVTVPLTLVAGARVYRTLLSPGGRPAGDAGLAPGL